MEFVLLGLLTLRSMSLYDINKALQRGISLFYSASFGSINAALNKMLEKGWVTAEEVVERGRNKKIFHPTPAGSQAFQEWLVSGMEQEKLKDSALTRIFFLGLAPERAQRRHVIESHIENMRQTLAALDLIYQNSISLAVPPEKQEVYHYQMLTLRYGRDYYEFSIRWYQDFLQDQLNKD